MPDPAANTLNRLATYQQILQISTFVLMTKNSKISLIQKKHSNFKILFLNTNHVKSFAKTLRMTYYALYLVFFFIIYY